MPRASGSQPPVSTSDEAAVHPLGLVGDAVARDTGGVLDDGLAAAEDAVHERGLADVRAADDRDDRQRRRVADAVLAERDARQQLGILVVELVVGEARAQGLGPRFGKLLVEVGHRLGDLVVAAFVFVVSAHSRAPVCVGTTVRTTSRTASTVCSKSRSIESTTVDAGGGGEEVDDGRVLRVAPVQRIGDGRGIVSGQLGAAARGAHLGGGGQQDAHGGVGRDDRRDVAALDDDARATGLGDERAEQGR